MIRSLLSHAMSDYCCCDCRTFEPWEHDDDCPYRLNFGSPNREDWMLLTVAMQDQEQLASARSSYGDSWRKRGGAGAFMNLARKWDRLSLAAERNGWDVFKAVQEDTRSEGTIDDLRDLRHYLQLVEAHLRRSGSVPEQYVKETPLRDDDPVHPEPCSLFSCMEAALPGDDHCAAHSLKEISFNGQ